MSVLAGVGAAISGMTGILNYGQQQQNLSWQRYAQRETWRREDDAVQRRVADLKAAGLSPTLAAGSAAGVSQPISTKAPEIQGNPAETAAGIKLNEIMAMKGQADITKTRNEAALVQKQAEGQDLANSLASGMNPLQIQKQQLDNEYSKQSLQDRVDKMFWDVEGARMKKMLQDQQYRIQHEGVTQAQIETARRKIARSIDLKKLSKLESEILINELAFIEKEYNLKLYGNVQRPTTQNDWIGNQAQNAANALKHLFGWK